MSDHWNSALNDERGAVDPLDEHGEDRGDERQDPAGPQQLRGAPEPARLAPHEHGERQRPEQQRDPGVVGAADDAVDDANTPRALLVVEQVLGEAGDVRRRRVGDESDLEREGPLNRVRVGGDHPPGHDVGAVGEVGSHADLHDVGDGFVIVPVSSRAPCWL